jgi:hypothetical protein
MGAPYEGSDGGVFSSYVITSSKALVAAQKGIKSYHLSVMDMVTGVTSPASLPAGINLPTLPGYYLFDPTLGSTDQPPYRVVDLSALSAVYKAYTLEIVFE